MQEYIKKLSPKHYKLMLYLIDGYKLVETAALMNISAASVSRLYNDPMFREALDAMREARDEEFIKQSADVKRYIDGHRQSAADTLVALLESNSDSVKMNVAKEILMLGKPPSRQEGAEARLSIVIQDPRAEDDKLLTPEVKADLESLNS